MDPSTPSTSSGEETDHLPPLARARLRSTRKRNLVSWRDATLRAGLALERTLSDISFTLDRNASQDNSRPSLGPGRGYSLRPDITLKPYQAADLYRLYREEEERSLCPSGATKGFALCYYMGLGKTLVACCLVQCHPLPSGPRFSGISPTTLVICPNASHIDHWKSDYIKNFNPGSLNIHVYHGAGLKDYFFTARITLVTLRQVLNQWKTYRAFWDAEAEQARKSGQPPPNEQKPTSVQSNYLRRHCPLYTLTFLRDITDEAHVLRNPTGRCLEAVCALKSLHRLLLTGTPAQNSLRDFQSIFRLLDIRKSGLDRLGYFDRNITVPLASEDEDQVQQATDILVKGIRDHIIYRPLHDVHGEPLIELPTVDHEFCRLEFSSFEQTIHKYLLNKPFDCEYARITRLRQLCSHPALLLNSLLPEETGLDATDPDRLNCLVDPKDDNQDVEVPEDGTIDLKLLPRELHAVYPALMGDYMSTKFREVQMILRRVPRDDKVIIFSHFTRVLTGLGAVLEADNIGYAMLTGSMEELERRNALNSIASSQNDCRVILISIRTGGCGLNITSCNHVILMEPWWNPYVDEQAIARAHRMGQTKPMKTYCLVIRDSIEDAIIGRQHKKRLLIGNFLRLCSEPDQPELHSWVANSRSTTRW